MHAVIPQADLRLRRHQFLHRARHQHLACARLRGDAGANVEGEADHFAAADGVFAGVQADPDLEAQRAHGFLDRGRAGDAGGGLFEGREHAIAGGHDLLAAARLQLLANGGIVVAHHLGPARIAELGRLRGGADDVDDQDGGEGLLELGAACGRGAPVRDGSGQRLIAVIAAPRDRGFGVVLRALRAAATNRLLLRQTRPVDLAAGTGAMHLHGAPLQEDRRANAPDAPRLRRVPGDVRLMDTDAKEFRHECAAKDRLGVACRKA